tara:strand:- start:12 stop:821 length:810 start_codon:yes stop_codon:yes gene_type:complete
MGGKITEKEIKDAKVGKFDEDTSKVNKGRKLTLQFYNMNAPESETFPHNPVAYKAFLTQYEDKYESQWTQEDVYGRMDPIQTFQGTKRVLSLAWDVVAASLGEAVDNLRKTEQLFKMLYPAYNAPVKGGATTIAASPLVKLKFGNLITSAVGGDAGGSAKTTGLLGTISGFSYAPDIEVGFFDVDAKGTLYPQTIKLSCNFTVLHTHELGWREGQDRNAPWDNYPYVETPPKPPDPSKVKNAKKKGARGKTGKGNPNVAAAATNKLGNP